MPTCLVSINPDLRSTVGHSLYLDRELAREAALRDWHFHSLGHRGLPATLLRENPWLHPVFRDTSHHATKHDEAHRERFFVDLHQWLRTALNDDATGEFVLFVYAGHVCQLGAFWRLLQTIPDTRLRVVFNLYAAYWEFDESGSRFQFLADTLQRMLGPGAHLVDRQRFILTSDSSILARLAEQTWGAEVPVLPFFSLAHSHHTADTAPAPARNPGDTIAVAYPSSVHRQRGFMAFPDMVRQCRAVSPRNLRFIFRTCIPETSLSPAESEACRLLRELNCELVYGSLSEEEMRRFYSEADIILNPYPVRHFKDRTTGNVADALVFGKPVIAAFGTWAGRLVEKLECGECFEDQDGISMAHAVLKVAESLPSYTRNAMVCGAEWARENHVGALIARVHCLAMNPPAPSTPEASADASKDWKLSLLCLLDSSLNQSAEAPSETEIGAGCPVSPVSRTSRREKRSEQQVALLQRQNHEMKRALEHFRASPVRALRLWFFRKTRRLWH